MRVQRFSRKTAWGVVGIVTCFILGLGGGLVLSHHIFAKKENPTVPKLSEVAAPPEQINEKFDPSALPPIGFSPVPPEGGQTLSATVEEISPDKIPWADPYPAYPFTLMDQSGQAVSLQDFLGKVVVVSFIYTNCKTICPLLTEELKQLQKALGPLMGREIVFLSLTIDPQRDTPEVLKRYGEEHGVDFQSWRFLTGSKEQIDEILRVYRVSVKIEHVSEAHKSDYELGHGNPVYLIDQWGRVRKRTAPTMLVRIGRPAIEWLVKEGASDVSEDEDLTRLRERRKP